MKQLQLNQMENVKGGSKECLLIATEVMVATIDRYDPMVNWFLISELTLYLARKEIDSGAIT